MKQRGAQFNIKHGPPKTSEHAKPNRPPNAIINNSGQNSNPSLNAMGGDNNADFQHPLISNLTSNLPSPTFTTQEEMQMAALEEALCQQFGAENRATPVVASMTNEDAGLIVDWNDKSDENLIPIGADWIEPLTPSDYDAYGDALNC